ncbi:hypothetical protein ACPWT1_19850 [Ramlibacter sp. MMS24-I3-19]|uniref:hypothetical protein n=1 Tax=Ramlibacter sp. MMS24-I3-19 TaxID=3416606 RepID=UPI003D043175
MNRSLLILAPMIAAAAAIESIVLGRIAVHPAGGGDETGNVFRFFVSWASLPLATCLGAAVLLARFGRVVPVARYAVALGLGVLLVVVALAQYGHATPGFLMLALVGQFGLVVAASWRAWRSAI